MKKRLVGFVLLSVLAVSCQVLPFWPLRQEESPSEDVVHLASNFCGVLVPDRGKIYGCKWYRDSVFENRFTRCLGIWERDVETGEMRPLWMDSLWNVRDYEVSRDFRYLFFIIASRMNSDDIRLMLMEFDTGKLDTIFSLENLWRGVISPYTPKRFYSSKSEQWGEVEALWSIDFRTHQMKRETSVAFPNGFFILPGAKGDSFVVEHIGSNTFPVNYKLFAGIYYLKLPDSLLIKSFKTKKVYRLTAIPPQDEYWYANRVWWVHDHDSLLICTFKDTRYMNPKEIDLWLIKNVTKHLQEVSP